MPYVMVLLLLIMSVLSPICRGMQVWIQCCMVPPSLKTNNSCLAEAWLGTTFIVSCFGVEVSTLNVGGLWFAPQLSRVNDFPKYHSCSVSAMCQYTVT